MRNMAIRSALILSVHLSFTLSVVSPTPSSAQTISQPTPLITSATTCNLEFEVKGRDIQILLGYSKLIGAGRIWCVDSAGQQEELPIKVTIGTPILFPRFSFAPSLTVRGSAGGIAILRGGPQVLLGKYNTIDLRLAAGGGVGTSLALSGEDNGFTITLGLQDVEGFGIAVGGTIVTIE